MQMGWLFKGYFGALAAIGRANGPNPQKSYQTYPLGQARTSVPAEKNDFTAIALAETNRLPTAAGNHYRALRIALWLIAIMIVFLAIAPVGFDLGVHTAHLWGGINFVIMIAMLLLVWFGRRARAQRGRVNLCARAEELRYAPLTTLIADCETMPDKANIKALQAELIQIMYGLKSQLAYSERKVKQYHAIEHFTDFLLWASVFSILTTRDICREESAEKLGFRPA